MPPSERVLLWWNKIGYGLGDIYGGGSGVVVSFYYLIFLTDIVRLPPALAGTVILISKIYDSITDPFEGLIADRTRTSLGRRRPYLLAGIPLIFLSFFALFYPYASASVTVRFAAVLLSYLFFSTVLSIVMLNYNALHAEITLDYNERAALSSVRIFFSTLSSIFSALLPMEIVKAFADVRAGYIAMGLAFGAFFALPFIATVAAVRERPEFQRPPRPFDWRLAFVEPFRNRTFLYTLAMYLFAFVAIDTVSTIVAYFVKYYLKRGPELSFVNGTLLVAQVFSLPFYVAFSRRLGKVKGYILGLAIWATTMFFSWFIGPASPSWAMYVFAAVVGLGTGGVVVMIYAIFPDIPDVDELRTGERREAIYSALVTFVRKLSSAFAIFAVSNVLGWAGYVPPLQETVEGVTRLIEQPQSETFLFVLRLMFLGLPVVFLSLALFFALRFPLTPQLHRRLRMVLEQQRTGQPIDEVEKQQLSSLLFGG
ncbi:MAG: MFS transporter [Anaerolineales bacterium]|nr:MFS transporter [Anaerolineales bacterium]MDW8226907.1 MFS transporter [Anaerolineales bacterium]